jgi:hypothetical protein
MTLGRCVCIAPHCMYVQLCNEDPDRRHATGRVRLLRVAAGVSTCFRGLVFRILLLATRLGQRRRRERSLLAGKN